jgi:hypothetical protein
MFIDSALPGEFASFVALPAVMPSFVAGFSSAAVTIE